MTIETFHLCPECRNTLLCCDLARCAKDYHTHYPLYIPPGPEPEQIEEALAKLFAIANANPENGPANTQ